MNLHRSGKLDRSIFFTCCFVYHYFRWTIYHMPTYDRLKQNCLSNNNIIIFRLCPSFCCRKYAASLVISLSGKILRFNLPLWCNFLRTHFGLASVYRNWSEEQKILDVLNTAGKNSCFWWRKMQMTGFAFFSLKNAKFMQNIGLWTQISKNNVFSGSNYGAGWNKIAACNIKLLGIQQHVDTEKMENFETIPLADESTQGSLKNFATKMKLRFVSSQNLRSHIQILQKFQSG